MDIQAEKQRLQGEVEQLIRTNAAIQFRLGQLETLNKLEGGNNADMVETLEGTEETAKVSPRTKA